MTYLQTSPSTDWQKDKALRNMFWRKRVLEFICQHPEGVTSAQLKAAGLSWVHCGRLQQLGVIRGEHVREPERGSKAYHWLWKAVKDAKEVEK